MIPIYFWLLFSFISTCYFIREYSFKKDRVKILYRKERPSVWIYGIFLNVFVWPLISYWHYSCLKQNKRQLDILKKQQEFLEVIKPILKILKIDGNYFFDNGYSTNDLSIPIFLNAVTNYHLKTNEYLYFIYLVKSQEVDLLFLKNLPNKLLNISEVDLILIKYGVT